MKRLIIPLLILSVSAAAQPEMRTWSLNDGRSLEAGFVYRMRDDIVLKPRRGRDLRIPASNFSDEDLSYVELQMPPKIDIDFSNSTKQRLYPPMWNTGPNFVRSIYYTFRTKISAASLTPYRHELTAEWFVMAKEANGEKHILLHYEKRNFRMEDMENGVLEMESKPNMLTVFDINGYLQAKKYDGYLVVVSDSRGEIIASKTTRDNWLEHIDNLRKVPVTRWFDESCNRCMPTRPKHYY